MTNSNAITNIQNKGANIFQNVLLILLISSNSFLKYKVMRGIKIIAAGITIVSDAKIVV